MPTHVFCTREPRTMPLFLGFASFQPIPVCLLGLKPRFLSSGTKNYANTRFLSSGTKNYASSPGFRLLPAYLCVFVRIQPTFSVLRNQELCLFYWVSPPSSLSLYLLGLNTCFLSSGTKNYASTRFLSSGTKNYANTRFLPSGTKNYANTRFLSSGTKSYANTRFLPSGTKNYANTRFLSSGTKNCASSPGFRLLWEAGREPRRFVGAVDTGRSRFITKTKSTASSYFRRPTGSYVTRGGIDSAETLPPFTLRVAWSVGMSDADRIARHRGEN